MKMFRFHFSRNRIHGLPELPGQNVGCGVSLTIVILEVFGDDFSLRVHNVSARVGDSKCHGTWCDRFIENSEAADDFRIGIREQRKGDVLAGGEIFKSAGGIVTYRDNTKPLLSDRFQILFQLNELDLAVRSPIRRTEKDYHGALWPLNRLEGLTPAILVHRRKRRNRLADLGTSLDALTPEACDRKRPQTHPTPSFRQITALFHVQPPKLHYSLIVSLPHMTT